MNNLIRTFRCSPHEQPLIKHTVARWMLSALVCCCIAGSQPPAHAAGRLQQNADQDNSGVMQYLSIPAAAFHPRDNSLDYKNDGYQLTFYGPASTAEFFASLELPQGSIIHEITMVHGAYPIDIDEIDLYLYRFLSTGYTGYEIAHLESACCGPTSVSVSGLSEEVNNLSFKYLFKFTTTILDIVSLRKIRVGYSLPEVIPSAQYLNIPPAGFVPFSESLEISNIGALVLNKSASTAAHTQAPVLLPDQATVLAATFDHYDASASSNVEAHLHRTDLAGSWLPAMSDLSSSGEPGYSAVSAWVTQDPMIDNRDNAYWVYFNLPATASLPPPTNAGGFILAYTLGPPFPFQSVSVPAAAFTPHQDGQTYENHGRFLKSYTGLRYLAPLYLPDGKLIRRMKFFYEKLGSPIPDNSYVDLFAYNDVSGKVLLTWLPVTGSGWTYSDSGQFEGIQINNYSNAYWLQLWLPSTYTEASHVLPSGVVVEVADGKQELFLPAVKR